MAANSPKTLPSGTRLENYEINGLLGAGNFGITYRATDHTLECPVVIKEFMPSGMAFREPNGIDIVPGSGPDDLEWYQYGMKRFLDEARTLAKFNVPSVVRVSRFLEAHGTAYFVMDYVDGMPLDQFILTHTVDEKVLHSLAVNLLNGLNVVHRNHYLHRDIKPANILVRDDGLPVLLDFGCARQRVGRSTQSMTVMGTPAYAPFEQFHEDEVQNPSADIYSLGATLFHCFNGKPPAASTARIAAMHDEKEDPVAHDFASASQRISKTLLDTINWMMQPYPNDRPQAVNEILVALGERGAVSTTGSHGAAGTGVSQRASSIDQATARLQTANRPVSIWAKGATAKLNKLLANYVGPLSGTLIRRAAGKTKVPETLITLLSKSIDLPAERDAFVQGARELVSRHASIKLSEQSASAESKASQGARPIVKQSISQSTIDAARDILADFMGPIAGIIIKKASEKSADKKMFCRLLAEEFSDSAERQKFLQRMERI